MFKEGLLLPSRVRPVRELGQPMAAAPSPPGPSGPLGSIDLTPPPRDSHLVECSLGIGRRFWWATGGPRSCVEAFILLLPVLAGASAEILLRQHLPMAPKRPVLQREGSGSSSCQEETVSHGNEQFSYCPHSFLR